MANLTTNTRAAFFVCMAMAIGSPFAQADNTGDPTVAKAPAIQPAGPSLDVSTQKLADAVKCFDAKGRQKRDRTILLIHGTGLTPRESWNQTYVPVLTAAGYNTCTVKLPKRALGDAQVSSEYAVFAVRSLYKRFGDTLDIVTHSQGALEARWAIKFFPDIREKVDDLVMLAGSNHGTIDASTICLQRVKACTPSVQQQKPQSRFLAALNSGDETPGNVSYTSLYTFTDEVVVTSRFNPSPALANGATNEAVQQICPFRPVTHIQMITDAVAFALARDAITHEGPAKPSRIDRRAVCRRLVAKGMKPLRSLTIDTLSLVAAAAAVGLDGGAKEPALKPYARRALPDSYDSRSSRPLPSLVGSTFSLLGQ